MAVSQTISTISTAPQLGVDSKEVFVQKAETVWAELKDAIPELNTAFGQINTTEANINAKEASASASATNAATSALAASGSANFKGTWSSSTAYTVGQSVLGSDNAFYVALQNSTNQNPTTTSGYWKVNVPLGAIGNINAPLLDMPLKNSLAMKAGAGSATFTRASTATYIDRFGVMKTAAIDEPRFEKKGYLNEGSSTNLTLYSNTLGVSAYPKTGTGASIVSSSEVSPDGVSTMGRFTEDTTVNSAHYIVPFTATSYTAGQAYTYSVYAKEDITSAKRYFYLVAHYKTPANTDAYITIGYDLATGTKVFTNEATSADNIAAFIGSKIEYISNGVYRISTSLTQGFNHTTSGTQIRFSNTGAGVLPYGGDGTSGGFVWGAQVEALAFPTSYIPTTTASVTRSSDSLSLSAAGNYGLPSAAKTISLDMDLLGQRTDAYNQTLFDLPSTSQYNRMISSLSTTRIAGFFYNVELLTFSATPFSANTKKRLTVTIGDDNASSAISRYVNGVHYATGTSGIVADVAPTTLYIGKASFATTQNHFGHITNLRVWDKALTATEAALC